MVSDGQFIFSPSSIPRPLLENFKNCLVLIILRLSRVTWSEKINLPGQLFEQVAHQTSINVQIPILYLKNLVKQVLFFVLCFLFYDENSHCNTSFFSVNAGTVL